RNPVTTAKTLATIDVLSRGRVILGAGVGWLREEFEAVSAPPFAERGRVTDEYLSLMRAMWTKDPVSFAGRFYTLRDVHAAPKPRPARGPPGGDGRPRRPRVAAAGRPRGRVAPHGARPTRHAAARRVRREGEAASELRPPGRARSPDYRADVPDADGGPRRAREIPRRRPPALPGHGLGSDRRRSPLPGAWREPHRLRSRSPGRESRAGVARALRARRPPQSPELQMIDREYERGHGAPRMAHPRLTPCSRVLG